MRFKRIIALVLILVVQQFGYCCAADMEIVKSYYILKYEYENFITPLINAGATEKELLTYFEGVEKRLNENENLTKENFEASLRSTMMTVASYRENRILSAIILSVYEADINEYYETAKIPQRMQGVYDALIRILFGEDFVDKSSLAISYEEYLAKYKQGMSAYTSQSVNTFKASLDYALALLKDRNTNEEQAKAAEAQLAEAYGALTLKPSGGGNSGSNTGSNSGSNSGSSTGGGAVVVPPTTENKTVFTDVSDSMWYYPAVTYLADKKVISGYGNGTFKPEAFITRAEVSKIICEALGLKNSQTDIKYNDIPENAWYKDYVECITANGVMKGMSDEKFAPEKTLLRQELAVIAHRLVKNGLINNEYNEVSDNIPFDDISEAAVYARESINEIKNLGIINGVGNNRFAPQDGVTRAQVAQIIYNLIK